MKSLKNSLSFPSLSGRKPSLLKPAPDRISKEDLASHKMFGSKRNKIQIGKKFRGSGKGVMKGSVGAKMPKSSGISPDMEDFDAMMSSVTKGKSKKSLFEKKKI